MNSTYVHTVAWIDHREAKILHFNTEDSQLTHVLSHHPDAHIHHKANSGDSGHALPDNEYLERVATALGRTGAILITGPANAKTELMVRLKKSHPDIACHVSAVESADHPTEGQLLAHGRTFFKVNDRLI
ncbi:MAG: translational machinery protein [Pseudomonadota bacterium]